MTALNPYLNFNGNTEEVFNFYRSVFGNEFSAVMRYKEMPAEYQEDPGEAEKIMHIALPIGNGSILMGSDVPAKYGKVDFGSSFYISVSTDSNEDADRIFNGLAEGGKVTMPLADAFWGSYFGMLKDKYGVQWMVSHDKSQQ